MLHDRRLRRLTMRMALGRIPLDAARARSDSNGATCRQTPLVLMLMTPCSCQASQELAAVTVGMLSVMVVATMIVFPMSSMPVMLAVCFSPQASVAPLVMVCRLMDMLMLVPRFGSIMGAIASVGLFTLFVSRLARFMVLPSPLPLRLSRPSP